MTADLEPPDDTGPPDRHPPQDIGAEQGVLGAMLLSRDAIADVVEVVTERDFYRPAHALIFSTIVGMYGRGEPVDMLTVHGELVRAGDVGRVGGGTYLHTLVSGTPLAANASYYAGIVAERAVDRRLIEAGTRIVQVGYSQGGRASLDLAETALLAVTETKASSDARPVSVLLDAALNEIEAIGARDGTMTGVPTGFADLDGLTHGLHPGQLVIVAGRPGMGKSTLALDWLRSACVHHRLPAVMFSLEMGANELVMRLMSAEARVALHSMRAGRLQDADWNRLALKMAQVSDAPLYVDDSPDLTIASIRAKARRMKQHRGLRMIVVDYLQLMTSGGRKVESRQQEVSEFSRSLKLLAKELDLPVVALSQLNRGPEQRTDKRPQLSDLRESGSLEQDADMVVMVHREDVHDPDSRPGEADLIVAKHRNGPTGTVTVAFQGHYSRFVDMAKTLD